MEQKKEFKTLQKLAVINLIVFGIVVIFEILSLFIDFPVLFVSEGDAAGIAEFTGNWFDHLLKALIGLTLVYIFLTAIRSCSEKSPELNTKAYAFIVGGGVVVVGIGLLYGLTWLAQFLDLAFSNNLSDWVWYAGFRLEILALFVNIPVLKIWKRKTEIFADLSTFA